jgi:hypothetical protein
LAEGNIFLRHGFLKKSNAAGGIFDLRKKVKFRCLKKKPEPTLHVVKQAEEVPKKINKLN